MSDLIKQSKTLCPETLKEIDSRILEIGGCVFLEKEGLYGKRYLVEKDLDFYKKLNIIYKEKRIKFDKVMIDITTRCNLSCAVCYRRTNSDLDADLNTLIRLSFIYKRKIISICGGEPTVRTDLPEIIRMFNRKNTVFLITNGIKLSDSGYLNTLKRNGLSHVSFSLNALCEDTLSKINGKNLLGYKLKALENLRRSRIKVVLAVALAKGVNEKELKNLFEFCLKNRNFIYEMRIRTMAPLGKYLKHEKLCLSEMIDIVARELGFDKENLLKEFELKRAVNEIFQMEIFTIKSCSFDFHVRIKNKTSFPIASNLLLAKITSGPIFFKKIIISINLIRLYGIIMVIRGTLKLLFNIEFLPWIHPKNIFKIGLRCWPDIDTIDLEENKRCRTGYWFNGRVVSFCYANIIKDRLNG